MEDALYIWALDLRPGTPLANTHILDISPSSQYCDLWANIMADGRHHFRFTVDLSTA